MSKLFDHDAVANSTLTFVDEVVQGGAFLHPDSDRTAFASIRDWLRPCAAALTQWARVMNPRQLGFREFDSLKWLLADRTCGQQPGFTGPDPDCAIGCHEDDALECSALLVASLGWVVRFWRAEGLFTPEDWEPGPPLHFIPYELLKTIEAAARGLRAGRGPQWSAVEKWATPPSKLSVAESGKAAEQVVFIATELRNDLEAESCSDLSDQARMFKQYDRLLWFASQLPTSGYEPCFGPLCFEDGDISATCAHTALVTLRDRMHLTLTSTGMETRGLSKNTWFPRHWNLVYWTPEARPLAGAKLPKINTSKWQSQLRIEQGRLQRQEEIKNQASEQPLPPFIPLLCWADIIAALNEYFNESLWQNDPATQRKIRELNNQYKGPIVLPDGRGKQPTVDKSELLKWWSNLREAFNQRAEADEGAEQEAKSAQASASSTHAYGRSGTVVPEIGGHIKKKRTTP